MSLDDGPHSEYVWDFDEIKARLIEALRSNPGLFLRLCAEVGVDSNAVRRAMEPSAIETAESRDYVARLWRAYNRDQSVSAISSKDDTWKRLKTLLWKFVIKSEMTWAVGKRFESFVREVFDGRTTTAGNQRFRRTLPTDLVGMSDLYRQFCTEVKSK